MSFGAAATMASLSVQPAGYAAVLPGCAMWKYMSLHIIACRPCFLRMLPIRARCFCISSLWGT